MVRKYLDATGVAELGEQTRDYINGKNTFSSAKATTLNVTSGETINGDTTVSGTLTTNSMYLSGQSSVTYGSSQSSGTFTYATGTKATSWTGSKSVTPLGGSYSSSTNLVTILNNIAKYCHYHTISSSTWCTCNCDYCSCDSDECHRNSD